MTVILAGVRQGDRTPLVLVRCGCCGEVLWVESWPIGRFVGPMTVECVCGPRPAPAARQPTLAQATAPVRRRLA